MFSPRGGLGFGGAETGRAVTTNMNLVEHGRMPLLLGAGSALVLGVLLAWLLPNARPGDPELQSTAIIGSLLLLGAYGVAHAKRFGRDGRQSARRHVWLACTGFVLVAAHSTGELDDPPALLLLALVALGGLGIWARMRGATALAQVFGGKFGVVRGPSSSERDALAAIIESKTALLATLEPGASEATFSLQPRHWLLAPSAAVSYWSLTKKELALTAAVQSLPAALRYWRAAHQLIAAACVLGLLLHVIVVTFFAAYAAEGGEIYWWHITAWDF